MENNHSAIKILPASSGWQWWKSSIRLLRWNPVLFLWVFLSSLSNFLPIFPLLKHIVDCIEIVFLPVLSAGLFFIYRTMDQSEKVSLGIILQLLRERIRTLLALGLICLIVICFCVLTAIFLITLNRIFFYEYDSYFVIRDYIKWVSTIVIGIFSIPAWMAVVFSPYLIASQGFSPGKALVCSFIACLKNWKAILINKLIIIGLFIVILIVGGVLFWVVIENELKPPKYLIYFLGGLLSFVSYAISSANEYFAFKAIFHENSSFNTQPFIKRRLLVTCLLVSCMYAMLFTIVITYFNMLFHDSMAPVKDTILSSTNSIKEFLGLSSVYTIPFIFVSQFIFAFILCGLLALLWKIRKKRKM